MPEESSEPRAVTTRADLAAAQPAVRILADMHELVDDLSEWGGARWTLSEPGRQLDANLVHLLPGKRIDTHTEPDLDVLLVIVAGAGTVGTPDDQQSLAEGHLVWLQHGSTRNITAGADGLSYLTVHRRRAGLQIKKRSDR